MAQVILLSSDGKRFPVDIKVAKMSQTICGLIEVLNPEEDEEIFACNPIPLPNVSSDILEKVLKWCVDRVEMRPEDRLFVKRVALRDFSKDEDLFRIICAANYLDVEGLLGEACCPVAHTLNSQQSSEQIRQIFNIDNDLSHEEEALIEREKSLWIDDSHDYYAWSCYPINFSFPLMELPNEIIVFVLKEMSVGCRLRSRLNKRLYELEAISRFFVPKMRIVKRRYDNDFENKQSCGIRIEEDADCSAYTEVLQKLSSNHDFGAVYFSCTDDNCPLIPTIKSISAQELGICLGEEESEEPKITDDSIAEWIRGRKSVDLTFTENSISSATLLQIFNDMASSAIALHIFDLRNYYDYDNDGAGLILLRELGITPFFGPDNAISAFNSTRRDVQIYLHAPEFFGGTCYYFVIGDDMIIGADQNAVFGGGGYMAIRRRGAEHRDGSIDTILKCMFSRSFDSKFRISNDISPYLIVYT